MDDRTRLPRQSLPEFLYVHTLEVFGQPQLAYEALVHVVANVRAYDRASPRARMFSRFLNLGGQPFPLEALNIFLASLVKLQNGQARDVWVWVWVCARAYLCVERERERER